MNKYKGYLIDLDGTMYRGKHAIKAAPEFIDALHTSEIPYLFLTNNSALTQEEIAGKLNLMGIKATPDHVFTSSLATAKYIKHTQADARCMVIGEKGLHEGLKKENIITTDGMCDFVVMGIDREITYEKLTNACLAIRDGAKLISTNSDNAIPTERGFLPGNGALTSVLTVSTGVEPIFIGKPEHIIMKEALATLGLQAKDTLMIGDNYYTDILAGINAGIDTLMVFTGITSYEEYLHLEKKPTYCAENLYEWIEKL